MAGQGWSATSSRAGSARSRAGFRPATADGPSASSSRRTTAAAACCGALFWLVGTVIAAVSAPLFLYTQHVSMSLAGWTVARSVLLNLVAFVACYLPARRAAKLNPVTALAQN